LYNKRKNNFNIIIKIYFKIFDENKKASTGKFLNKAKVMAKEDQVSGAEKQRLEIAKNLQKTL
jgi:ABC-type phosphate/phosphonate transport system ATPase subunit